MLMSTALISFQEMDFAQGLQPRHLATLAGMAQEVTFAAGEIIFREGEVGKTLYLVQEGRVALDIYVPRCGPVTILSIGPGQIFGTSAMFESQAKQSTGRAMVPTKAIAIDAIQLREACQADHDLGYAIMSYLAQTISERVRATRLQLLDMLSPDCVEPPIN
jgi:CRP-like cAMP-binding protein